MNLQGEIVEIQNVVDASPFCLCIRKTSPFASLLVKFDATMSIMEKDGTLRRIYSAYE